MPWRDASKLSRAVRTRCARSFLSHAEDAMSDVRVVRTVLVKHDLAYAAMHDVGEAMLSAYGCRTTRGEGAVEYAAILLEAARVRLP